MHTDRYTDAGAAHLMENLPAFSRWDHRPLNRQLRQLLANLDEQTLMSLTAHAVRQIESGRTPARRLPI